MSFVVKIGTGGSQTLPVGVRTLPGGGSSTFPVGGNFKMHYPASVNLPIMAGSDWRERGAGFPRTLEKDLDMLGSAGLEAAFTAAFVAASKPLEAYPSSPSAYPSSPGSVATASAGVVAAPRSLGASMPASLPIPQEGVPLGVPEGIRTVGAPVVSTVEGMRSGGVPELQRSVGAPIVGIPGAVPVMSGGRRTATPMAVAAAERGRTGRRQQHGHSVSLGVQAPQVMRKTSQIRRESIRREPLPVPMRSQTPTPVVTRRSVGPRVLVNLSATPVENGSTLRPAGQDDGALSPSAPRCSPPSVNRSPGPSNRSTRTTADMIAVHLQAVRAQIEAIEAEEVAHARGEEAGHHSPMNRSPPPSTRTSHAQAVDQLRVALFSQLKSSHHPAASRSPGPSTRNSIDRAVQNARLASEDEMAPERQLNRSLLPQARPSGPSICSTQNTVDDTAPNALVPAERESSLKERTSYMASVDERESSLKERTSYMASVDAVASQSQVEPSQKPFSQRDRSLASPDVDLIDFLATPHQTPKETPKATPRQAMRSQTPRQTPTVTPRLNAREREGSRKALQRDPSANVIVKTLMEVRDRSATPFSGERVLPPPPLPMHSASLTVSAAPDGPTVLQPSPQRTPPAGGGEVFLPRQDFAHAMREGAQFTLKELLAQVTVGRRASPSAEPVSAPMVRLTSPSAEPRRASKGRATSHSAEPRVVQVRPTSHSVEPQRRSSHVRVTSPSVEPQATPAQASTAPAAEEQSPAKAPPPVGSQLTLKDLFPKQAVARMASPSAEPVSSTPTQVVRRASPPSGQRQSRADRVLPPQLLPMPSTSPSADERIVPPKVMQLPSARRHNTERRYSEGDTILKAAMKNQPASASAAPADSAYAGLDLIIRHGDVLCVNGIRGLNAMARLGANGGYMGHVLLAAGVPRCIIKESPQAGQYQAAWPDETVRKIWLVQTVESTRIEEGLHETMHLLYIEPGTGFIRMGGEERSDMIIRYQDPGSSTVEVWQSPDSLRSQLRADVFLEALADLKAQQGSWSWSTAVRAFLMSAEVSEHTDRDMTMDQIQEAWRAEPICTSVVLSCWQRYLCKIAAGHSTFPAAGSTIVELGADALDLILKWMPMRADRTLPGELLKLLQFKGWTNLIKAPKQSVPSESEGGLVRTTSF